MSQICLDLLRLNKGVSNCVQMCQDTKVRDLNMNIFHEWIWAGLHFIFLFTYCMSTAVLFIHFVKWNITKNSIVSSDLVKSILWAIPCSSGEKPDRNITDQQKLVTLTPGRSYRITHCTKQSSLCVLCPWVTLQTSLERKTRKNIKRGVLMRLMGWARECVKERESQSLLLQRNTVESKIWDHSSFCSAWFSFYKQWQDWRRK